MNNIELINPELKFNYHFNYQIIRGYDIRGIYNEQFTNQDALIIGLSFGFYLRNNKVDNRSMVHAMIVGVFIQFLYPVFFNF